MLAECLDSEEGTGVADAAAHLGVTVVAASAALQRLRRKGLAENGHGTMGWSWFATARGKRRTE